MPPGNANCHGSPVRSSWKGRNANENDNHTVLGPDLRVWPDGLRDWASGLKYELLDSEENPGDRDGGGVYEVVLTEGYYPGFSYVICGPDDCYLLIEGCWYSVTNLLETEKHALFMYCPVADCHSCHV